MGDNKINNKDKIAVALNEYFVNTGSKPTPVAFLMDLTNYTWMQLNEYAIKRGNKYLIISIKTCYWKHVLDASLVMCINICFCKDALDKH